MSVGVLKVGALTLNENYTIADATNAQSGVRTVNVSGVETYPGRTLAQVQALADDLTAMFGKTVPVTFSHKTDRSGYYTIDDVNTTAVHWDGHATGFTWSLGLSRIGPDNAVDIESRMTHVVRLNDFSDTGERWHAPPIGHSMYYVGAATPATVVRTGADGPITVYRAIPAVNPRYGCPVGSFLNGRVRFLDGNGIERTGQGIRLALGSWELNNGLVRVKPYSGGLTTSLLVAFHDGTAWREKAWDVRVAGDSLRPDVHLDGITILRNDPEMVSIRLMFRQPSNGQRVMLDLSLRRGSRYVAAHLQRTVSGDLLVELDGPEGGTTATGYITASGEDANGIRYVVGSAKSFTASSGGGVFKTPATQLDFFIGAEIPKAAAAGGDPGFETGTTAPWSPSGGVLTVVSGGAKYGTYFGRLTANGGVPDARFESGFNAPVVVGRQYTISAWLRSPVALAAGAAQLRMRWYNGGITVSNSDVPAPALAANVWTPVSGTATAPATTLDVARLAMLVGTPAAGTVLDVDNITIREAIDSGDSAAALYDQYIAAGSETTMVVAR